MMMSQPPHWPLHCPVMEWTRPPLPQPPDRTPNDPRPRQGCISLSCTVRCSLQPPFAGHGSLIETCFVPTKGNSSKERQSPSNSHQTNPHHPSPHTHPSNIAPIVPLGQGRAVPGRISRLCARPSGSTTHLDTCLISLPPRTRVVRRNRSTLHFRLPRARLHFQDASSLILHISYIIFSLSDGRPAIHTCQCLPSRPRK